MTVVTVLVHLSCTGHFVLLHHTEKQEEEKEGMCDRPGMYLSRCVTEWLYCGVCVRGVDV